MRRILAIGLASLIFLITSGMVVTVHECHSEGKKDLSVFQDKGCCSKKTNSCKSGSSDRMKAIECCDVTTTWIAAHVETILLDSKTDLSPKAFFSAFFASFSPSLANPLAVFSVNSISDPPDLDKSYLTFGLTDLGVFRIWFAVRAIGFRLVNGSCFILNGIHPWIRISSSNYCVLVGWFWQA